MVDLIKALYKLWLSINSTFWMISVYGIKNGWTLSSCPIWLFDLCLVALPLISSFLSILAMKYFTSKESVDFAFDEIELADNNMLPIYLGYFFVSLGLDSLYNLLWVYGIVLVFVYVTSFQYFNPIYIVLGYHFYHVKTQYGTKVFFVKRGKVIRNPKDLEITNLYRLNDSTFIGW